MFAGDPAAFVYPFRLEPEDEFQAGLVRGIADDAEAVRKMVSLGEPVPVPLGQPPSNQPASIQYPSSPMAGIPAIVSIWLRSVVWFPSPKRKNVFCVSSGVTTRPLRRGDVVCQQDAPQKVVPPHAVRALPVDEQDSRGADRFTGQERQVRALLAGLACHARGPRCAGRSAPIGRSSRWPRRCRRRAIGD